MLVLARSALVGCLLVACGGVGDEDPLGDFAGSWTFSLTNGENGCLFPDWNEGNTTDSIPVTITQSDVDVSAFVEGLWGTSVQLLAGTRSFEGEAEGEHVVLSLRGQNTLEEGECSWSWIARLVGDLDDDLLTGEVQYSTATNGHPDCDYREDCVTVQSFNAIRPPE